MGSAATLLSAPRITEERGGASETSGGELSSEDSADLLGRAALFRHEAEVLRERARETGEMVVGDQYFKLAERWVIFAVALEARVFT